MLKQEGFEWREEEEGLASHSGVVVFFLDTLVFENDGEHTLCSEDV